MGVYEEGKEGEGRRAEAEQCVGEVGEDKGWGRRRKRRRGRRRWR